jgi:ribosome modulation factor
MTAAGEVAMEQLLERTVELKHDLMAFLHDRRISRELHALLERRYGSLVTGDEEELALVFDRFILEHRLPDGRTVVERFVRARGDLPKAERQMLLGWSGGVSGSSRTSVPTRWFFRVRRWLTGWPGSGRRARAARGVTAPRWRCPRPSPRPAPSV